MNHRETLLQILSYSASNKIHNTSTVGDLVVTPVAANDNATMEPSFALPQRSALNRKRWRTREELHNAITTWIERNYHRHRRQYALGRLTPIEYETITNPTVTLAA